MYLKRIHTVCFLTYSVQGFYYFFLFVVVSIISMTILRMEQVVLSGEVRARQSRLLQMFRTQSYYVHRSYIPTIAPRLGKTLMIRHRGIGLGIFYLSPSSDSDALPSGSSSFFSSTCSFVFTGLSSSSSIVSIIFPSSDCRAEPEVRTDGDMTLE